MAATSGWDIPLTPVHLAHSCLLHAPLCTTAWLLFSWAVEGNGARATPAGKRLPRTARGASILRTTGGE